MVRGVPEPVVSPTIDDRAAALLDAPPMDNILLVGAGAVGQVYARHLQKAGARISFFVKPKYKEELSAGVTMYPLNGKRGPVRFENFGVVSTAAGVAELKPTQIWLCVSSPALKGSWLEELAAAAPEAVIVSLQPGLETSEDLARRIGKDRLVGGIITFIAWQAPLPGETLSPPGVMYWTSPLAPSLFDGPDEPTRRVVALLKAGGCPAKRETNVQLVSAQGEAWLQPMVAALEAAGWSWRAFTGGPMLELAGRAAREALAVAADHHRAKVGPVRFLSYPRVMRLVMWLAPKLLPFDIETYFAYHFTKVGEQTREHLATTVRAAKARGLSHQALEQLQGRLSAARSGSLSARGDTAPAPSSS